MKTYPISNRNRVKRISNKSDYSKETVHAIIDEALFCHLGIIHDGKPVVIPTIHARMGDQIVFHGSNASRLLKISNNNEICVTITLLDGLVMARSLFNSSMNYRSAVIFGIVHLNPIGVLNAFLLGLIYGYIRIRTNSLFPSIFLHSMWNAHIEILIFIGYWFV